MVIFNLLRKAPQGAFYFGRALLGLIIALVFILGSLIVYGVLDFGLMLSEVVSGAYYLGNEVVDACKEMRKAD